MAMEPKETIIYAGVAFLLIMGIYSAITGLFSMGITWIIIAIFFLAIFKQLGRPVKGFKLRKIIILGCSLALFALGLYNFFQGLILSGVSWVVAGILALLMAFMVKGPHDFNQI
ncbi:hypothetical protein FGU46_05180 [Methanobacterium sp. CWC-01]|uniref:hypothetical protein n=1 Tax=Methanobacterium aridiramus TaxID=2584467 RepID=UPI002575FBF3|nr:hypothetical protein [Methanobacterium sp. CWC-01]WJI09529.1 hypothetical protein FGU46_05180 [Methanobacterium sp. CWC-01]